MLVVFFAISDQDKSLVNSYIISIASGDNSALEGLYLLVGGRLLSVAQGIMRNKHNAEDVLQDSFIKIVRYAHQFRGGSNGYGWLCKIVQNTALNKLKSEQLRRADNIDDIFGLSDGKDFYRDSIQSQDIKDALLQLEPKERLVIWLKYYNDMTIREISADTGIKKTTVQDLIKRAEQKLTKLLQ